MIDVRNINKSFDDKHVLKDVSLVFEEGKQNLIIGQSGSGKTVLLKCLVGLFEPDNGSILYSGRDFVTMNKNARKEIRKEIGMLFQGSALFDSMTVMENVMFPLLMFSDLNAKEQIDRANFCIDRVGLTEAHNKLPSEISGGMQKRAAIARAISLNPKYLFCDEPNSGLDPKTGVKIDHLIEEITQEYNITTVINTHDMNSVIQHGDNINYIYEGEVWWQGNKSSFLGNDNPELLDFIYSTEILKRIKPKK
ncbi:MAG: ATP-binding cassette domain-containing protein [Bacteroidales bacterium]|nr:ATP-binding cassette domain-containing protein [Bacteroidales bacterium]